MTSSLRLVPFLLLSILGLVGCPETLAQAPNINTSPVVNAPLPSSATETDRDAPNEIANNNALDNIKLSADVNQLLGNTELTQLYSYGSRWIPKCTTLFDYPSSAGFWTREYLLAITVKFPTPIVIENLPTDMRWQLSAYKIDAGKLDVFFHTQFNDANLGEAEDHTDGSTWTTRLRPHGWADPDVPLDFTGDRVNRDFLVGIFDVDDISMQDEVLISRMKAFNLSVHDSKASPRNMRIKLPGKSLDPSKPRGERLVSNSQAFWSLVIDAQNPTGQLRAVATLHWLIGDFSTFGAKTSAAINDLIEMIPVVGPDNVATTPLFNPKLTTWQELFQYLKTNPKTASESIVRKLDALVNTNSKSNP